MDRMAIISTWFSVRTWSFIFLVIFCSDLGFAKLTFKCVNSALELPMGKVCDHIWDCPDGSDEIPGHYCRPMGPSESVIITSPGWPDKYPNNASMTWTFEAMRGLPLLLNIVTFDLERGSDFLMIGGASYPRDPSDVMTYQQGHAKDAPESFELYANLTGNDVMMAKAIWRSEVSRMWMYFQSDSIGVDEGFKMILFTPAVCDKFWQYFDGSCYRLIDIVTRYQDAALYCLEIGGHLAVIQSEEENDVVAMVAGSKRAWIGASRVSHNHKEFSWINGEKRTYTNWRKSEPNNYSGRENCVEINYVRKGLWNDHFCFRKKPFVCELPAKLYS